MKKGKKNKYNEMMFTFGALNDGKHEYFSGFIVNPQKNLDMNLWVHI